MEETNYPKEVKLANEELKTLIEEKGKLVLEGRAKSEEIDKLQAEMDEVEKELIIEEKKVDLKELHKKEKAISKRMDKCIVDIKNITQVIYNKIKAETPQELRDKYDEIKKRKEDKETERNKLALQAQKRNDVIIPLARKLMEPYLDDEFCDYDTVQVKDGEIVASIFSHLQDFKTNFNKKKV